MSLITIDRSLFASNFDNGETRPVTGSSECSSKSSQSEDFLMCKATAVGLNVRSRRRSSFIKPNDEIQDHLKKILELLRFGDYVQLVVRLQCEPPRPHHHRYCCVISTTGKQGTEESAVLGIDVADRRATIGLVLPIWQDMLVKLYGDGGFELITKDTVKQFKPVSVQALWAAFQAVNRACQVARINDYYSRGLTHDWVSYYHSLPTSDTYQIQEWLKTDDIDEFNRYTPSNLRLTSDATNEEKERARMESLLRRKLEEIMCVVDLEEVTVLQLRERLEDELNISLHDYRHFIEKEVLVIFGRMDEASVIFNHLLLGTTFNASNRAELERRSVSHILNVTREVDNFFPNDKYEYKNIRVFDDEQSSLLPYFEEIHRFINEAKSQGTSCLVHCKMGISRSATAVIAYTMKEQNWDLDTAFAYVKCRRPCVQPNPGFMRELRTYQGILEASSNRHKPIFCKEYSSIVQSHHMRPDLTTTSPSECPGCTPPILTPNVSPPRGSSPVDLESDLFAYKSAQSGNDGSMLKLPASCGPRKSLSCVSSTDSQMDRSHFSVSQSVTDIRHSNYPSDPNDQSPLILARNSHCLRQWHPSLAEIISTDDKSSVIRKPVKSPQLIRFAEVNSSQPFMNEQVDEFDPPTPAPTVGDRYLDVNLSGDTLRITLCPDCKTLRTASVSEALLLYTGIGKQYETAESGVPSHDSEHADQQAAMSSPDSRHMCNSSKFAPTDASGSSCTSGAEHSSSHSVSINQPAFCMQTHAERMGRRTSYPSCSIILPGSFKSVDSGTEKQHSSSVPSVFSVASSEYKLSQAVLLEPLNFTQFDTSSFDQTSFWDRRRDWVTSSGHFGDIHPVFRSVRNRPASLLKQDQSKVFECTRSISANHSTKARLRPDDSWILFPRMAPADVNKADLVVVERIPASEGHGSCSKINRSASDVKRSSLINDNEQHVRFSGQPRHHHRLQSGEANNIHLIPSRVWIPSRRSYPVFTQSRRQTEFLDADEHASATCDLVVAQR